MILRIRDWDKHFENNKSRERDSCSWCPIPNKQDGLGYGLLLREKNGAALYGAFVAVVLICSKQSKPRQGWLTDTGVPAGCPYSARQLSVKCQIEESIIERMIKCCVNIGWIDAYDEGARQVPAKCPPSALEGKGREGNRIEEKEENTPSAGCSKTSIKNQYGELKNVRLTKEEYDKLVKTHGEARALAGIEVLDGYIGTKRKDPYNSHYAALKASSWVWERISTGNKLSSASQKSTAKAIKDQQIAQYKRDILHCQTRDDAIRFMSHVEDALKDPVAAGWVMDAWVSANQKNEKQ